MAGRSPRRHDGSRSRNSGNKTNWPLVIIAVVGGGLGLLLFMCLGIYFVVVSGVEDLPLNDPDVVAIDPLNNDPNSVPAGNSTNGDDSKLPGDNKPAASPINGPNSAAGTGMSQATGYLGSFQHWGRVGFGNETDTFQAAPEYEVTADWAVEVDPATSPIELDPAKAITDFKIPIPEGNVAAAPQDILFPSIPSPIVCVGQHAAKSDVRDVWNLATMTKVGTIRGVNATTAQAAISPDGAWFVGVTSFVSSTVGVWDVKGKKVAANVPLEWRTVDYIAIPSPDKLLLYSSWEHEAQIFSLPKCELLTRIPLGKANPWAKFLAITPGGKYLLAPSFEDFSSPMSIYEIATGELVGKVPAIAYGHLKLTPVGAAVSGDGKRLAIALNGHEAAKILIIEMATGKLLDHVTLKKKFTPEEYGWKERVPYVPIAWFPERDLLLLYEHTVVRLDTKQIVQKLRQNLAQFPGVNRPLAGGRVTALNVEGRAGYIVVEELPQNITEGSLAGDGADAVQGPAPIIAWPRGALPAVLPVSVKPVAASWSIKPDPQPPAALVAVATPLVRGGGTVTTIAFSQRGEAFVSRSTGNVHSARIPTQNEGIIQLRFSRGNEAAMQSAINQAPPDLDNKEALQAAFDAVAKDLKARATVDVYDLTQGKKVREILLPYDGDVTSITADGSRMLVLAAGAEQRVDIYDTATGTHILGFVPYQHRGSDDERFLVNATFLDSNHVLTLSGQGELTAWETSSNAVVAKISLTDISIPSWSPGGRYIGGADRGNYYIYEVQSGNAVGTIPNVGTTRAATWSDDGTRLAVISQGNRDYKVSVADIEQGIIHEPFPIPISPIHARWFGNRYVLLDNEKLLDVDQKTVAWTYEIPGDSFPGAPDLRHWYAADKSGTPTISALSLPDPRAVAELAGKKLEPAFALNSGDSCEIRIDLRSHAGEAVVQSARQDLQQQLTGNGMKIQSGARIVLMLTNVEQLGEVTQRQFSESDSPFAMNPFATPSGNTVNVSIQSKVTIYTAEFLVNGVSAWRQEWRISNEIDSYQRSENESLEQIIERSYVNSVQQGYRRILLPPYVFAPESSNGLGKTIASPGVEN